MTALNHAGNEYAARLAEQSRTPPEFKVETKIYFHHHNYAKFHVDLGGSRVKTIAFANHRYITDDKREQDQLDLVADNPGTFIYTMSENDVSRMMAQEAAALNFAQIMGTAAAAAAVNQQPFDPNVPIVPVNVNPVQPTMMTVAPVVPQNMQGAVAGVGTVGLANSFSGTQATEALNATMTQPAEQTVAPNASSEAMARLAALTANAQKQQTPA